MYVHELITLLQKFPRESRVLLLDPQRGDFGEIVTILDQGIRVTVEPEQDPSLVLNVVDLPKNLEHLNQPDLFHPQSLFLQANQSNALKKENQPENTIRKVEFVETIRRTHMRYKLLFSGNHP